MLLEEELTALAKALSNDGDGAVWKSSTNAQAAWGSATVTGAGVEGGALPLGIIGEDVLEKLAVEIPDMRVRVGVM